MNNNRSRDNGHQHEYRDPFITRGGVRPDTSELQFEITTSNAAKFLQSRINTIGDEKVQIRLLSMDAGRNFVPFICILPAAVLAGNDAKPVSDNPDDGLKLDIDDTISDSDSKYVKIKQEYFEFLSAYTYNKAERDSLKVEKVRQMYGMRPMAAAAIRKFMVPKKFNEGTVVVALDPIKVFHSFLTFVNDDNKPFEVDIVAIHSKAKGEYVYKTKRVPASNRNNNNNSKVYDIYKMISRQLRTN